MWQVSFTKKAAKEFSKLEHQQQQAIVNYLDKVVAAGDPYRFGKPLVAKLSGFWRYRVGKYRIICDIQEQELIIEVITVAKRDKIYL